MGISGGGEVGGGAIYFWWMLVPRLLVLMVVACVDDGGCWSWVELHWIEWFLPCHCIDLFKCPRSVPQKSSKRPGIWTLWTVSWYLMGRCDSKRPKFPWNSADGAVWAVIQGLGELLYKRRVTKNTTSYLHEVECETIKKKLKCFFAYFLKEFCSASSSWTWGSTKRGSLKFPKKSLANPRIGRVENFESEPSHRTPLFFVEGLFRFSRLCNHHDLYDLYLVIFPRLPVVGYVFLSPGRVTLTKAFPCVSPWQSHDFFPGQGWWPRCRFGKVPWRAAMALQALLATDGMPQKSGQRKTSWGCRCVPKQMFGNYHRHGW